jgi:hypothetical protein
MLEDTSPAVVARMIEGVGDLLEKCFLDAAVE